MEAKINCLAFNDVQDCFVCGLNNGLRVYNTDPLIEKANLGSKIVGGVALVAMLHRTNMIAIVPNESSVSVSQGHKMSNSNRKLLIWDDFKQKFVLEMEFDSPVVGIKMSYSRLAVVLPKQIKVFSFPGKLAKTGSLDTRYNPKGLCEMSSDPMFEYLAFPAYKVGGVQIMGTLIRLFDVQKKCLLAELRRGTDPAVVYCIKFSADSTYLCASSDKGTIHIFCIKDFSLNKRSALQNIGVLSSYIGSQWALAKCTGLAECPCICGFGSSNHSVIAIYMDGTYHKFMFAKDGTCNREAFERFLNITDDQEFWNSYKKTNLEQLSQGRSKLMTLQAIKYTRGKLEILDQLLIPHRSVYVNVNSVEDAWKAIKTMQVRGAPAIAIVGCLSLAVDLEINLSEWVSCSKVEFCSKLKNSFDFLLTARPTAVNLYNEMINITALAESWFKNNEINVENLRQRLINALENIYEQDLTINKKLASFGAAQIMKGKSNDQKLTILTHCNTGSLATAGYGTALGIIRKLVEEDRIEMVYFTETRPYNQGARLTAYELKYENIPSTLICDSMACWLMKTKKIDAVVTGADRVALNGDTANKIGTYSLAVLAHFHHIPFYVACPTSTFHAKTPSGTQIIVEQRPGAEMTCGPDGQPVAPLGTQCWNPAFDITPQDLIHAVITEYGVFRPQDLNRAYISGWRTCEI